MEWCPRSAAASEEMWVSQAAGFRVVTPEMPWSRNRVYDRTYEQAMDEIAAAAGKLKAQGAERGALQRGCLGKTTTASGG